MVDVNGATQSSVVGKVMLCLRQSVDKQPAKVIGDCVQVEGLAKHKLIVFSQSALLVWC